MVKRTPTPEMPKPLYVFEGKDGFAEVWPHKITMRPKKGWGNPKYGDKDIYLENISAIQVKKPSLLGRGVLRFSFLGSDDSNILNYGATPGENMIQFDSGTDYQRAVELKRIVEELKLSSRSAAQGISETAGIPTPTVADELIKLSALKDQGVISKREFEQQKKRLLNGK